MRHSIVLYLLLMCGMSHGAPPLTTIQDTLYKADGSPFEGVLTVNWKSFEAPDASSVPTNNVSVQIIRGALLIRLVPTVTSPNPAYYSVRYSVNGVAQASEYWSVPMTANKLRLRDVRLTWPPDATGGNQTGTIPIGSVEGLPQELSNRPEKAANFVGPRAAVIGSSGQLASATGNLSDCLRVDGTAGPCGIEGLTAELGSRPTKGSSYAPSRAAVIGQTGQLEAASGAATNCVRADGSTGPCDSASLTTELNNRPTKGSLYFPSKAAVISSTGQLEAAIGASNYCVRVDGTSVPCDISGLSQELSVRPTKGASYVASRTAVIGPLGTLEGASGVPYDCVRVDGTSGPCGTGTSGSSVRFTDAETPSGAVNGFNLNFTLSGTPSPAVSLQLFRNGLLQTRGVDFNVSGNVISFLPASVPRTGDLLSAFYRY